MELVDFNNRHLGETVFILGNGEELSKLTKNQIETLKKHTTIGVNYSNIILPSTYMISGHFSHILYAKEFLDISNTKAIFFQGVRDGIEKFKIEKIIPITTKYFFNDLDIEIPRVFKDNGGYLIGSSNVLLSATNLAYVMGAKRIIFIGFNQRNRVHFYDCNSEMKDTLRENIKKIREKYPENEFPRMSEINHDFEMFQNHMLPIDVLRKTSFFLPDILPAIKKLFETLLNNGVEIISTESDSKLVDGGAKYENINFNMIDKIL